MSFFSRTALVVAATVSFTACDFLDAEPQGSLSSEIIFTDPAGAEAAINGAYSRTQGPMDDYVIHSDLAADWAVPTGSFPSWAEVDNHNIPTNNAEVGQQWTGWYALINQANIILDNIDGATQSADNPEGLEPGRAAEIKGEALTMRAYGYHNLVKWFGGVPLIFNGGVDFDNLDVPRSSEDEVYAQIIADLREARDLVADERDGPFIDRDAVLALLARVLLYDEQYAEAGTIAADVASRHPLAANYGSIFASLENDEVIWGLQYTISDSNAMAFFAFISGRFEYGPTAEAINAYGAGDTRPETVFAVESGTTVIGKYDDVTNGTDPHIILRGAEMLLIQAEARARAGDYDGAVALVNRVRARASAEAVDASAYQSESAAIDLILAERARELAYEGHRWHDLTRTGRAVGMLPTLTNPEFTLWPIPRRETDLNQQLRQNPGY